MRIAVLLSFAVFLGMAFATTRSPEAQALDVPRPGVDVRALTLAAGPLSAVAYEAH